MGTVVTAIWMSLVLLFLGLILCYCLYLADKFKKISKKQSIIQHQNELIYELLLKITS